VSVLYLGVLPHGAVGLRVAAAVGEGGGRAHVRGGRGGQLVLHLGPVHLHGNDVFERL